MLTDNQKIELAKLVEENKTLDAVRLLREYLGYVLPLEQCAEILSKICSDLGVKFNIKTKQS